MDEKQNQLFREVLRLTGLPEDLIGTELVQIIEKSGFSVEKITLDELRYALLTYLLEIAPSESVEA
ncbi:MAG: hypothetical protein AB7F43_04910 [Bacteriovoracia bacterium]